MDKSKEEKLFNLKKELDNLNIVSIRLSRLVTEDLPTSIKRAIMHINDIILIDPAKCNHENGVLVAETDQVYYCPDCHAHYNNRTK